MSFRQPGSSGPLSTVGRPEIQKFVGALYGRKAKKGIFITTATYSKEARDYADSLDSRVIPIDGVQLAELMFDHGIGVSTANSYVVKRIDSDFFEDDEVGTNIAAQATAK
jgi:restriction system protein